VIEENNCVRGVSANVGGCAQGLVRVVQQDRWYLMRERILI
jgi:hypothetical protein